MCFCDPNGRNESLTLLFVRQPGGGLASPKDRDALLDMMDQLFAHTNTMSGESLESFVSALCCLSLASLANATTTQPGRNNDSMIVSPVRLFAFQKYFSTVFKKKLTWIFIYNTHQY